MMQRLRAHIRRMHSIHLQADFYRIVVTYNYAEAVFKKLLRVKVLGIDKLLVGDVHIYYMV